MNVDQMRRVEAVLDAALTREPAQWPALLDEACSGDAELRREVESFLARLDTARRFLDSPPGAIAAALIAESREAESRLAADSFVGRRIGAYLIDRELGRGGMSRVFLAERADGHFTHQVALKLLRPGLDSDRDLERLRAERQILATLNHPNIARLFDGGVTEEGLPYLVMEYIDGQPLDRYCRERRLSVKQRLQLFRTVVEATEYAHRNMVVHRDLKPSNILVTADGTVKLLDFGLAKLLEPDARVATPMTRAGHGWMTPEYAAPEQIRGEPVNTVTDVYQLGVVLYELLTGRLPFADHSSLFELQTAILDKEPEPPSAAVLRVRAAAAPNESGTAREGGDLARTRSRALRGDLDAIVMKALHKEPDRRYASAAAFREDLGLHLAGRAVRARPDSAGYRLRKFVRRHRGGVTVAAALTVGVVVASIREYRLRSIAEAETRTARAVEQYLLTVFGAADPFLPTDSSTSQSTARELLDRGVARLDTALAGQPEVRPRLRTALGRVYANVGLYDQAAAQLELALSEQRALTGVRHPAAVATLDELGVVRHLQGRMEDADSLLSVALGLRRALLGSRDSSTASTMEHLAEVRMDRDDYDGAEKLAREAVAVRRALHGDAALPTAVSEQLLAELLERRGANEEATALYRRALATHESLVGLNHPLVAQTMFVLALAERRLGRIAVAESLYRRTLTIQQRTLGEDHPLVASTLNGLADLLQKATPRIEEAESLLRQALAINRRRLGEQHPEVSTNLGNLAVIVRDRGEYDEAEQLLRQALAIDQTTFGPEHTYVAYDLNELAVVLRLRGKPDSAASILRRVLALTSRLAGAGHRNTIAVKVNLGRALRESGRYDEAVALFREALGQLPDENPDTDPFRVNAAVGLGRSLVKLGKLDEALPLLKSALDESTRKFGAESFRTAEAHLGLGECLRAMGRGQEGRSSTLVARTIMEPQRRTQPVLVAEIERELSQRD
ncbi:MAG TPA: serine/threonine-protein kinase [Gemmatimonadaceae bacterium]|nr:serine/threonine-protein kinase [Gemmatimonadaceae bacterium]